MPDDVGALARAMTSTKHWSPAKREAFAHLIRALRQSSEMKPEDLAALVAGTIILANLFDAEADL